MRDRLSAECICISSGPANRQNNKNKCFYIARLMVKSEYIAFQIAAVRVVV